MGASSNSGQLEEERMLCTQLANALLEEKFLKQKSPITWLKNGDGNIKFFYNACKGRWNSNQLLKLKITRAYNIQPTMLFQIQQLGTSNLFLGTRRKLMISRMSCKFQTLRGADAQSGQTL